MDRVHQFLKSEPEGCLILKCGTEKDLLVRNIRSEELGLNKDSEPENERKV